jgi:hypothetical protein
VIVPAAQFDLWLDCANVDEKTAAELMVPAPGGSMEVYAISNAVNRVANDSAALLEPAGADASPPGTLDEAGPTAKKRQKKADTRQGSLF